MHINRNIKVINYMKEKIEFPYNNWYLEFTEEQRPIVDNWRINIIKFSDIPCSGNYISWRGDGKGERPFFGLVKITYEQFCKYVLNIEKQNEIINEDLSYLNEFLKTIKQHEELQIIKS